MTASASGRRLNAQEEPPYPGYPDLHSPEDERWPMAGMLDSLAETTFDGLPDSARVGDVLSLAVRTSSGGSCAESTPPLTDPRLRSFLWVAGPRETRFEVRDTVAEIRPIDVVGRSYVPRERDGQSWDCVPGRWETYHQVVVKPQRVGTLVVRVVGRWAEWRPGDPEPETVVQERTIAITPSPLCFRSRDGELAEVGERLPGFAGMYLDETDRLVVRLTDPSVMGPEALDVLDEVLVRSYPASGERRTLLDGMRVEPADYDYAELNEWRREIGGSGLHRAVMRSGGVVWRDGIDEERNRIVLRVSDERVRERVRASLRRLPIPEGAWVVELGLARERCPG